MTDRQVFWQCDEMNRLMNGAAVNMPRILGRWIGTWHVTTATYPSHMDTVCGMKAAAASVFATEGHPEFIVSFRQHGVCAACMDVERHGVEQ